MEVGLTDLRNGEDQSYIRRKRCNHEAQCRTRLTDPAGTSVVRGTEGPPAQKWHALRAARTDVQTSYGYAIEPVVQDNVHKGGFMTKLRMLRTPGLCIFHCGNFGIVNLAVAMLLRFRAGPTFANHQVMRMRWIARHGHNTYRPCNL